MATAARPEFASLQANTEADVCVIGAGIAGLSTAYHLLSAGKSVVVLDDGLIVSGETERTTAHLVNALDDRYFELERLHGPEGAKTAAASHTAAIDTIERIVREEAIDCDFVRLDGYLFSPKSGGAENDLLNRELAAIHRAGLVDVERVARAPFDAFDTGPALRFPRQAQFHPLKYLATLANVIVRRGGQIFTETHATNIKGGQHARVETNHGAVVTCRAIVVATNTPVNDRIAIHTKQAPYRTYVIGVDVPAGSVPMALYWDTADPYHYVRVQRESRSEASKTDLLIVGGEDHKTGQADDADARYTRLEAWTRARFPMMMNVRYRWSGQVMEPADGMAFIGRNPMDDDNVYIATGDSGNGMTHGTIAGILLSDLINGRQNPWASLYNPSRVTLGAAKDFARENVNMVAQYADWLSAGDVEKEQLVPPGEGAIVRHGLTKAAVYRDDDGTLHECSAVCPHLGAIVCWNHGEKTWDCPAHGSRYDRFGRVLNGPANSDLKPIEAHVPHAR
jgi:glycine/D-amino acid oxidase-like deaminating enzyme/nitrite reductase/ring-hydroxylating ferredoxin subunit